MFRRDSEARVYLRACPTIADSTQIDSRQGLEIRRRHQVEPDFHLGNPLQILRHLVGRQLRPGHEQLTRHHLERTRSPAQAESLPHHSRLNSDRLAPRPRNPTASPGGTAPPSSRAAANPPSSRRKAAPARPRTTDPPPPGTAARASAARPPRDASDYEDLYAMMKAARGIPDPQNRKPIPLSEGHLPAKQTTSAPVVLLGM